MLIAIIRLGLQSFKKKLVNRPSFLFEPSALHGRDLVLAGGPAEIPVRGPQRPLQAVIFQLLGVLVRQPAHAPVIHAGLEVQPFNVGCGDFPRGGFANDNARFAAGNAPCRAVTTFG